MAHKKTMIDFSCFDVMTVTFQKVREDIGAMRISFLKAAKKIIPPLAQRPLDSKILPQHRRKRWSFMELISYGAALR